MCTFCGRNRYGEKQTKTVKIYGKNDKYIGQKEVPMYKTVRGVNKMLNNEYGFDWEYHTGC